MEIKSATPSSTRLLLPEYGRNVQKMVHFLRTIEDRALRNRQAEVVVGIMANLYPYKRDTEEFRNMLWDHLFMIADFDLDIDSPYPKPTAEQFSPQPLRVPYPSGEIKQKQYGRYAVQVVAQVAKTPEQTPEDCDCVMRNMARFMRQKSYDYNNEHPDNHTVIADVNRMLNGAMVLGEDALEGTQLVQNRNNNQNNNTRRRNNNQNNNQNNNKRKNNHQR